MQHLSEQEIKRRQKLEELEKLGIEAYPSELFDVTFYAKEIHDNYHPELNNFQEVALAGRLMSSRVMGVRSGSVITPPGGRLRARGRCPAARPANDG